jgi:hypothetical protein
MPNNDCHIVLFKLGFLFLSREAQPYQAILSVNFPPAPRAFHLHRLDAAPIRETIVIHRCIISTQRDPLAAIFAVGHWRRRDLK